MKHFDLNIDKFLEDWDLVHAIRELIANALDEAHLTGTHMPTIFKTKDGVWCIQDSGRGIQHKHLIQNESPEKHAAPSIIGRFGVGLKDALATFERRGAQVSLLSKHGDISLLRRRKEGFNDETLHAAIAPPSDPARVGTLCRLMGIADKEVEAAKSMFLVFRKEQPLATTQFGDLYAKSGECGQIFYNGLLIGEEQNFRFSYNITSATSELRKGMNRERKGLGRGAYASRVQDILLRSDSKPVRSALAAELENLSRGLACDEMMQWLSVQLHAVKILNAHGNVVFLTSQMCQERPDLIDAATTSGSQIIQVPERLADKISGACDYENRPLVDAAVFWQQRNDSFEYEWVSVKSLDPAEAAVWRYRGRILALIGGRPPLVRQIRIAESLRPGQTGDFVTKGVWDPHRGLIVIKRSALASLEDFAGTLLHEALHAKFEVGDVSREFESRLTDLAGTLAAQVVR